MGKVILGMTISLDGFINDRSDRVEVLYPDLVTWRETEPGRESNVTDGIESAITQAKAAAGDKEVNVIGAAKTAQQCLKVGLADELHIDIMPVLLGGGLRPFEGIDEGRVRLERIKVMELPGGRTHLKFHISK